MYKKINSYFLIFIILFSIIPIQAVAPIKYYEIDSDIELRGAIFINVDPDGFYASLNNGIIQIDSNNHYNDVTIKFKGIALNNRLKKYNGFNVGYIHISNNGIITNELKSLEIDYQGFAYLNTDFSTVIINGMTGITTTTLNGLSRNQSISVSNGSSYDLNITNNQLGVWVSSDGKNYINKSIITINGSMVTSETGIPLQLFTNFEGVNGTGDIGIAYTNLTAIPREVEYIWDNDNVSLYFPFNTASGVDSEFIVLWGSDNTTEPAADSIYGNQAVWDGYSLVYLMNENPNGDVVNAIKDSTANGYDATPNGSMTFTDLVDDIGKAIDFDGSNDYLDEGSSQIIPAGTGAFTLSLVTTQNSYTPAGYDGIVGLHVDSGSGFQSYFTEISSSYYIIGGFRGSTTAARWTVTWADFLNERKSLQYIYKGGTKTDINNYDLYIDGALYTTGKTIFNIGGVFTHNFISADSEGSGGWSKLTIEQVTINPVDIGTNYAATTHKNLNNPTATGTVPFYKSIGTIETTSGTVNITASITGDNNTQSYNTSQFKEFTLTPTGETNNVLINTTCTDYDVTVTTYWTENITLQTETVTAGYAKQYINYTPSFNVTSADLNTTFTFDFNVQDYIGTVTSTLNDVSKTTIRDGQDINASVGSLIKDISYLWNVTVLYNNIFTLSNQSDTTAFLGVSKQFNDSTYNDPDNNPIFSRLWNFGDNSNSSTSNPTHIYTSLGVFNANYTITENATTNNQTITKEFNVSVEIQPPQNVTTISYQTNISINWNNYTYADKYSVYELEDGFSYVNIDPVIDGVKDAIYDYAHEFLIFSSNPVSPGDYETSYSVRTSLGAYFFHEAVDNDDKLGDDDLIYYFDLDNDGLTVDDPAWKITNNIVKKYLWNGGSWQVTGVSDAVGVSTGGSTHYPKHELFIPIAELGANWTNGSTVKVLVKREDSSLTPDVVTWYPCGNINNTDTSLWQEMVLNNPESYTWLANVTLSNYTALNLTSFTIYHGAVSAWNGSEESSYTTFDVITEDVPVYNVSGYIFDDLGNKLSGVIIYSCNGFVHEITQSNIYGYWIGYNFREGNYTICGNKSGYIDNSTDIYVSSNMTNVNVTLTAYIITDWEIYQQLLLLESQNDEILLNMSVNNTIINDKIDTILIFILLNMAVIVGIIISKRGKEYDN